MAKRKSEPNPLTSGPPNDAHAELTGHPVSTPGVSMAWTTTSSGVMKRLHAAGILARNTFGQPLVFEYAPEDRSRIEAVLGAEAMG